MLKIKFFEDMKETQARYGERIQVLEAEKDALTEKLSELKSEYAEKIEKEALGIEIFANERQVEKAIDDTTADIAKVVEKIGIVKRSRKQTMKNQLPGMREAAQRRHDEISEEWRLQMIEMNKAKAEFLLALASLGKIAKKVDPINELKNEYIRDVKEHPEEEINVPIQGESFRMYFDPNDFSWRGRAFGGRGFCTALGGANGL